MAEYPLFHVTVPQDMVLSMNVFHICSATPLKNDMTLCNRQSIPSNTSTKPTYASVLRHFFFQFIHFFLGGVGGRGFTHQPCSFNRSVHRTTRPNPFFCLFKRKRSTMLHLFVDFFFSVAKRKGIIHIIIPPQICTQTFFYTWSHWSIPAGCHRSTNTKKGGEQFLSLLSGPGSVPLTDHCSLIKILRYILHIQWHSRPLNILLSLHVYPFFALHSRPRHSRCRGMGAICCPWIPNSSCYACPTSRNHFLIAVFRKFGPGGPERRTDRSPIIAQCYIFFWAQFTCIGPYMGLYRKLDPEILFFFSLPMGQILHVTLNFGTVEMAGSRKTLPCAPERSFQIFFSYTYAQRNPA